MSFSYTEIECLLDCAFLYLHAHKISIFPQALNYTMSYVMLYRSVYMHVCVLCDLFSALQGYAQSIAMLIIPHSVSAPLIRRTG